MSFEKRKAVPLAAAFLIAVGIGSTATADTGVEIYSTNVTLNGGDIGLGGGDIRDSGVVVWNSSQGYVPAASVETDPIQSGTTASDVGLGQVENEAQVAESGDTLSGTLDLGGNDLTSSGTTVWDSTNGFVPASSVEVNPIQSGTTSSDVGLGQVRNVDVSTIDGNDLNYDTSTESLDVDTSSIRSGVTSSDVGLGSVQNEAQVAEAGDTMTGELKIDVPGDTLDSRPEGIKAADLKNFLSLNDLSQVTLGAQDGTDTDIDLRATGDVALTSDVGGAFHTCTLEYDTGDFTCDGSKNWAHSLNNTHESVYTAQESPQVRAVYEGQAATSNGRVNVSLPSHFSKTVSDTRPSLRVQVTPHSLASVAVTERTDDYLVIESSKDVAVDYRVTGIREGYEDKQVVRKK